MGGLGKNPPKILALTGTPGTGKSSAARALQELGYSWGKPLEIWEVGDLARALDRGYRVWSRYVIGPGHLEAKPPHTRHGPSHSGPPKEVRRKSIPVDMGRLARILRKRPADLPRLLLVGHLAHLLPVDAILLLRCNPLEIGRRLRLRGDGEEDVRQNMEAEWTDVILFETVGGRIPIFEHDATPETPRETARWVERVLRGKEVAGHGTVDWLGKSPPEVTLPPSL